MLEITDVFLSFMHSLIILINLFGWIWYKTRRLHLWVVGITLTSWVGLGLKYGFGYCFLTDWHWDVKRKLGEQNLPSSFIQYLFETIGFQIQPAITDVITVSAFALAILGSIYLNFFRIRHG